MGHSKKLANHKYDVGVKDRIILLLSQDYTTLTKNSDKESL